MAKEILAGDYLFLAGGGGDFCFFSMVAAEKFGGWGVVVGGEGV